MNRNLRQFRELLISQKLVEMKMKIFQTDQNQKRSIKLLICILRSKHIIIATNNFVLSLLVM